MQMMQKKWNEELVEACRHGDLGAVYLCIQEGASLSCNSYRPLGIAVEEGNIELVRTLLAAGAKWGGEGEFRYLTQIAQEEGYEEIRLLLLRERWRRPIQHLLNGFGRPGQWLWEKIEVYEFEEIRTGLASGVLGVVLISLFSLVLFK